MPAARLLFFFTRAPATAAPVLIAFFICLAIAFRGRERTKGYAYSALIFAAVTTALSYPEYSISYAGFTFTDLIPPLIHVIMFGMGTSMSSHDFVAVAKTPKAVVILF